VGGMRGWAGVACALPPPCGGLADWAGGGLPGYPRMSHRVAGSDRASGGCMAARTCPSGVICGILDLSRARLCLQDSSSKRCSAEMRLALGPFAFPSRARWEGVLVVNGRVQLGPRPERALHRRLWPSYCTRPPHGLFPRSLGLSYVTDGPKHSPDASGELMAALHGGSRMQR
jgi:hypothetical protein